MNISRIPSLFSQLHGQNLLIKNSSKGPVKSIPRNIEALKKNKKRTKSTMDKSYGENPGVTYYCTRPHWACSF
nr:unnamed protein product [Callosobruchus analis]